MKKDLKQEFRAVLIQIAENLPEEQREELLFYCKDHVPRKDLSISSQPSFRSVLRIFDRLEDSQIISWEDLSFLMPFMRAIGREDLVTKLAAFELTRELTIYAWTRNGSDLSLNSSTASVGHYLAEMVDLVQDRVDVRGLICPLLQSGKNANNILDAVSKALSGADVGANGNWSAFALLVAIAAEIVSVASKVKVRDHHNKYAVKLATELGNHLSLELAKLGSWEDFCQFVGERYNRVCSQQTDLVSNPSLSWQLEVTDMVKRLRDTIFY